MYSDCGFKFLRARRERGEIEERYFFTYDTFETTQLSVSVSFKGQAGFQIAHNC